MKGRTALVTGGGRGIGEAASRLLAREGARVIVVARTTAEIERVAREVGGSFEACDVTAPEAVDALARAAGPVDILVNNAGIADSAPFTKMDLALWRRVLDTNLTSAFLLIRAFLPGMLERRYGRIVNVASVAGKRGAKYIAAYAASKHGLLGLTSSLAAELEGTNVRANAVCPGYVDTPMTRGNLARVSKASGRTEDEVRRAFLASAGQPRLLTADEVAGAIVRLASSSCGENGAAVDL